MCIPTYTNDTCPLIERCRARQGASNELGEKAIKLEFGEKLDKLELEHRERTNELELENGEGTNVNSDNQDSKLEENSEIENKISEIELSDSIIKGLHLLYVKNKYTLLDWAFKEIMEIFGLSNISLYRLQKIFSNMVLIEPTLVDILKMQYKDLVRAGSQ
ncbi:hypothetical protein C2G38_2188847 [Gigaspora rosea]|uniref:Uncharacterized protein n=1 Tax=Gigaspora rosea TaxID=44941 RepID=A0A397V345_9GLOM|nr:hypothetical protein C2G38_2188847 [Gigaspora rosea]